jgi:threonine dehydratase
MPSARDHAGAPDTAPPGPDDLHAAARRIAPHAHRTPVLPCSSLDEELGARLFFKCENFQRVGAFKFRGACNAVFSLDQESAAGGVVTHSSGNHGAALALAARLRGIPATVVIPEGATAAKRAAVARYGAEVVDCRPGQASREAAVTDVLARGGGTLVHPYDDVRVIAGQGTAALELLEQAPDLDRVMAPVGGGGLMSGTAIAVSGTSPAIRITGVEPALADEARRSLAAGRILSAGDPPTLADGLRTTVGQITFPIIQDRVEGIVAVSESAIVEAMRLIFERMKIVVEPSAAVCLAALRDGALDVRGERVGIILSGGNVDLGQLPWQ